MPSILLVASAFAPSRAIGGRRAERIASFLAQAGWQVTVLTLHPAYAPAIDSSIAEPADSEIIRSHAAMPRTWLRPLQVHGRTAQAQGQPVQVGGQRTRGGRLRSRVLALARKGFDRAVAPVEFPDEYQGWRHFALHAVAGRRFDVVMATMPPFSSATLALELVRRSGGRLVLDYRDPWCEVLDPQGRHGDRRLSADDWRRMQQLEAECLAAADLVIGVTPTICGWLAPRTRAPVVLISNGLDGPPPRPLPAELQPPRLVYAGSLAYGRSLEPVLAAMARLGAQAPLELVYAGPHGDEVARQAAALGLTDRVRLLGNIAMKEVLALYRGALAGIVSVSAITDYGYPGKLFEVLGAGCPVLLLAPAACDAAQLVRRHQAGWVHDGPEIDGLVADLRSALAGGTPRAADLDRLAPQVLMGELEQRLRALLP